MNEKYTPQGELEAVLFNPDNITGFDDRTVLIDGATITYHDTNNMLMKLDVFERLKANPDTTNPFEKIYDQVFKDMRLDEIMAQLQASYPNRAIQLLEEIKARNQRESARKAGRPAEEYALTKEQVIEKDIRMSELFDAMAPLAKEIDPTIDLSPLFK